MDELRQGQSGSKELAKELVLEVLSDPETPLALKQLLQKPDLRASTRHLLYSLVALPYTTEQTHRLLKTRLDWLLVKNQTTEDSLAATFHHLLKSQVS